MKKTQIILLFALSLVLSMGFTSCEKEKNEYLQIAIRNKTDSDIRITVFPKQVAPTAPNLYPIDGKEGGGHKPTQFVLSPNDGSDEVAWDEVVRITDDLNITPFRLTLNTFDSIHITFLSESSVTIKFTHENVTGYSENIFSEESTWNSQVMEEDRYEGGGVAKSHRYTFVISKDKLLTKKDE
jgi:hypothetical protein